ncbi:hypothetical protein SLEP1_g30767 [Rubroshorea leprosula]|uniref:Defensin-like protein n=1 Tax=Rubroshorea leprosula TaxID=152421 RepID=A0AAV5KAS5_9ROSI|nr:hypothetical protein SLEP1_g30767 [Rubroshorea leprosula]
MKCLQFLAILMLALLFATVSETTRVRTQIRVCGFSQGTNNCTDANCNDLCLLKFGDGAGGLCQPDGNCICFTPC